MVTLEKIRKDMKDFLAVDKQLQFVEVMADSIGEALEDASVQLDVKPSTLQYEIVEKGSEGFMGLGKKPWKLKIYPDPASIKKVKKLASDGLFDDDELSLVCCGWGQNDDTIDTICQVRFAMDFDQVYADVMKENN